MTLIRISTQDKSEVDLRKTYDAIVVGSGAAGGMAAHVLTSHGMKVLGNVEAGKKIDTDKELKSSEWPYQHKRREKCLPIRTPSHLMNTIFANRPTPPIQR